MIFALCAPTTPRIIVDLKSNGQLDATLLVSIWELGEVMGPLLIGPLAEIYSRLRVYHAANIQFAVFCVIAVQSQNIDMLIAFRFLRELAVASTTLYSCIVGDLIKKFERGRALVMGMPPLSPSYYVPSLETLFHRPMDGVGYSGL